MKLNELRDNPGARGPRKRLGRGMGSGLGKTSGKGHKGAKARAGGGKPAYFEGGQMPLYRRLPKRGFNNIFRADYVVVNLDSLQKAVDAGRIDTAQPVDAAALVAAGLVGNPRDGIRLLGRGSLQAALTIEVVGASASAVEAVEKAGGKVNVIGGPVAASE
ncbi:50S ribosomal protein L15 [Geminicoccus roseus]|uniref:50S ribosomal protein L15 n=1 Tax=Geminicoccus roseus TaxID=404900 RepID=UPI0003F5668D|nr:50S ribosomal protein L15 [Geminicoccus roseus]